MATNDKDVNQHPRQYCYFCGSDGPIETHHIVPRRHDGSDKESNLVDLCPTCHERLERLYDNQFYQELEAAQTTKAVINYNLSDIKDAFTWEENEYFDIDSLKHHIDYADVVDSEAEIELVIDDLLRRQLIAKNGDMYTWMVSLDMGGEYDTRDGEKKEGEYTQNVKGMIKKYNDEKGPESLKESHVYENYLQFISRNLGVSTGRADATIEKLRRKGEVYEPMEDVIRTT